ncbi:MULTISPECIES: YihY/virulence factor BrkB family protein [unclassified Streptomyces]|uniref:YihY/virulence factor BrkB family protein n=1 Tax=unclassified Streptomyces TaxID=2593676 RepID=UPI002DD96A7C|nr:YihY/virulence factor BrkB family protein [Streptomyces sp. NBC_01750]WSB04750.1 YihY/virulence factor BrkB family protein [Streptomyces sp. NBC_01794]WSD30970.1 YihY/virulence factor BrkB family protein [Streptomyces sp. NBC_01750]
MQGERTAPLGLQRDPAAVSHGLPSRRDVLGALGRTPVSVWSDDVTDWAAALTYYAVLALFPTLLVTVSFIGIADSSQTQPLIERVAAVVPTISRPVLESALQDMAGRRSAAWFLAVAGTASAVWSASSYLAVFRRALHAMHGVRDQRSAWRTAPRVVLTACLLLGVLVSSALVLMLSGRLARTLGQALGMGSAATVTWDVMKWPLLLCLVATMVLVLFRSGPAQTRGVRRRALGGALAVVLWLVSSVGFALYTAHVGTYDRLYGSLAGIIVFLVWLWVSNLALLIGAQFNAELAKAMSG